MTYCSAVQGTMDTMLCLCLLCLCLHSATGQGHFTQSIHDMLTAVMDDLIQNTSVRCMFHFIDSSSNQNRLKRFTLPTSVFHHENIRQEILNILFLLQCQNFCPGWVTGSCARTWWWTWTPWSRPPPSWRPTEPSCPSPATTTSSCSQHPHRRQPSGHTRSSNTHSLIREYSDREIPLSFNIFI